MESTGLLQYEVSNHTSPQDNPSHHAYCSDCNRRFAHQRALQQHLEASSKHRDSRGSQGESQPAIHDDDSSDTASPTAALEQVTIDSVSTQATASSEAGAPTPEVEPKPEPKPGAGRKRNADAIDDFFTTNFPDFPYNPKAFYKDEFMRLRRFKGWNAKDDDPNAEELKEQCKNAQSLLNIAVVDAFQNEFGDDADDPAAWGKLCEAAGIDARDVPEDLEGRMTLMLSTHVNLVDLQEGRRAVPQTVPRRFETVEKLRVYTLKTKRIFPKGEAYRNGLLALLLREITGIYYGKWKIEEVGRAMQGG